LINLAHVESRVSESGWLIGIALSAHFLVEGQYHSPEVREENCNKKEKILNEVYSANSGFAKIKKTLNKSENKFDFSDI